MTALLHYSPFDTEVLVMLDPVQITPAQFYGPVRANTGARRLLLAILDDAVYQVMVHRGMASRRAQRLYRENLAWFFTDDDELNSNGDLLTWSCRSICQHLGIDVDYLRRKLLDPATTVPRGAYRKPRRVVRNGAGIPTSDYYLTKGIRQGVEPQGRKRYVASLKEARRAAP